MPRVKQSEGSLPGNMPTLALFFEELETLIAKGDPSLMALDAFFRCMEILSKAPEESTPEQRQLTIGEMSAFLAQLRSYEGLSKQGLRIFDPWAVVGLGRNEIRNCRVLAWALDPRGTHGYGAGILNELIKKLRRDWISARPSNADVFEYPFPEKVDEYRVTLELSPFADPSKRVDIVLDGPDFCVFLEVKIDAGEGREQTKDYLALAERRAKIMGKAYWGIAFIAPRKLARISADGPRVLQVSWPEVALAINTVVGSHGPDTSACSALLHFAAHIRRF